MRTIHFEAEDPARELAIDEAALLEADEGDGDETLRLWEFTRPVVVIGRSSKFASEVNQPLCQSLGIPVLRRCSGGSSIAAGPGCLMYSVVLSFDRNPEVQKIDLAHQFVMQRLLAAVRRQLPLAEMQGTCDLTWKNRKFSGNSLRLVRRHLLYHGTILYDADLELIARCLATPPRQPEYRRDRPHSEFLTNIPVDPRVLGRDIEDSFLHPEPTIGFATHGDSRSLAGYRRRIESRANDLLKSRYADPAWHSRH